MDFKLNAEQQKKVSENIGLIYAVAKEWHIDLEEYWDSLAEGLCIAAHYFDESNGTPFCIYACVCMKRMYIRAYNHFEKRARDCWEKLKIKPPISFDEIESDTRDRFESEYIDSGIELSCQPMVDDFDNIEMKILFSDFYKSLKDADKKLIKLLATGDTITNIGKRLGISRQAVSLKKVRLQKKFKTEYLGKTDLSYKRVNIR